MTCTNADDDYKAMLRGGRDQPQQLCYHQYHFDVGEAWLLLCPDSTQLMNAERWVHTRLFSTSLTSSSTTSPSRKSRIVSKKWTKLDNLRIWIFTLKSVRTWFQFFQIQNIPENLALKNFFEIIYFLKNSNSEFVLWKTYKNVT